MLEMGMQFTLSLDSWMSYVSRHYYQQSVNLTKYEKMLSEDGKLYYEEFA